MGAIGTINGLNNIEQIIMENQRKRVLAIHRARFAMTAHLNWQRNHAAIPKHLLQLKKPIMPERWKGPREGWIQWSELLINPGITIKGMPDLQGDPLTAKKVYDAIVKLKDSWRI